MGVKTRLIVWLCSYGTQVIAQQGSPTVVWYTISAMTYDGLVVAAVVAELNKLLAGGRIQSVRQHNNTDFTLEVRAPGRTYRLFLSVDARFARLHLTAVSNPVPKTPPQFCMLLRKHLEGSFIVTVEQVRMDRIIVIRTLRETRDSGNSKEPLSLVHEIMGKHSNLVLIDSHRKILGAAKHVGTSLSRARQILPGMQYLPPPGTNKLDITELDKVQLEKLTCAKEEWQDWESWLVEKLSGFGPFLAREVVARSVGYGSVTPRVVATELTELSAVIKNKAYEPVFITDERGCDLMVYPIRSLQFPQPQQHTRSSISEALDALFRSLVSRTTLEDERTQLLTAIRRAAASRLQTLKSIASTLEKSESANRYREIGELLLANLHAIEKGSKSTSVIDLFDPNLAEIEIQLDERLTPQQNAERYFKRYQKARDAAITAAMRRETALRELTALQAAISETESASDVRALQDIKRMLFDRGLLRQSVPARNARDIFEGRRIKRLEVGGGWEILYGENAQANDYLTQKIARPNDVWLHARSIVGAHVVIRTAGHAGPPPKSVILAAAEIAARNSEGKNSSLVPVDYTLKKHVRKPRGSAPGFVNYTHEKTVDVELK